MNKDLRYWVGYITTIICGVILTPIYAILITLIRAITFIWELLYDIFTFMPKAIYEYERASLRTYWEKEQERIKKMFKKD
tara:strand:- start:535 stop:774 length:240 start_codon:yes stop_codon:yes gene_type:complete